VRQALDYLRDNALPANAAVRPDVNRFGLMGHSAGGQALTFAATNLQPAALVLLDPVSGRKPFDRETSPAKEALSLLSMPTLTLYAEEHQSPASCNKNSLWKTFGNGSAGSGLSAVVRGGSHCDGENPARRLCGVPFLGCGKAATKGHQDAIAQYATAWLETHLKGDATFAPCVAPARLMQDARLREVEVHGN
jgi:acetyl esterase/lipase